LCVGNERTNSTHTNCEWRKKGVELLSESELDVVGTSGTCTITGADTFSDKHFSE
jgi:hypothetical protein